MRKVCTACGIEKDYGEFPKRSHNKSGIRAECFECTKKRARKYYIENKESQNHRSREWKAKNKNKIAEYMDQWREAHAEDIKKYRKNYAEANREKIKSYAVKNKVKKAILAKEYRKANKERERLSHIAWAAANPEKKKDSLRRWRVANPEKAREEIRRANIKRQKNPKFKINDCVSRAICASLKQGAKARRHWEALVGYTIDQLRMHLEKKFTPEMNWQNYGTYWHIDHKIPVVVHNFSRPEDLDFRLCWSLKNLQPLEATENRIKSARIEKPFQPSLAIQVVSG